MMLNTLMSGQPVNQSLVYNTHTNNEDGTNLSQFMPLNKSTNGGFGLRMRTRKIPATTRHSSFSNANEAVSFFRADIQPLSVNK